MDCHFEGEELHIDVNNNIDDTPAKVMNHREFSTCLGNHDLLLVCSKRKIPFKVHTITPTLTPTVLPRSPPYYIVLR